MAEEFDNNADINQGVLDLIVDKPAAKAEEKVIIAKEVPPRIPVRKDEGELLDKPPASVADEDDDLGDYEEDTQEEEEGKAKLSAPDDTEVEVTVDGQVHKVTLKDLKSKYSFEKAIESRLQKASETKNHVEAQASQLFQANNAAMEKLKQIDSVLEGITKSNVDWEALKARDPLAYALKREEVRDAEDKRRVVRLEANNIANEQAQLQADALNRYLTDQAKELTTKWPEMGSPETARPIMESLTKTASQYGYTQQELESVTDHRALLVLKDAMKYRALQAKKAEAKAKVVPVVVKTMQRPPTSTTVRPLAAKPKADIQAMNRARQTGKPEDVAMTLLQRK